MSLNFQMVFGATNILVTSSVFVCQILLDINMNTIHIDILGKFQTKILYNDPYLQAYSLMIMIKIGTLT